MEPQTSSTGDRSSSFVLPEHVLDDLCSRFIINIPEEERQDLIRIFFQIELAHWFYLDFYCQEHPELKSCGIKHFSAQIFKHCPFLIVHSDSYEDILKDWKTYKLAVPTYGAILLDPTLTHCLLVQGFWNKSSWGFPKGKVNEEEAAHNCAVREVFEETGFDIKSLIDEDAFIEHVLCDQVARLYIIPGVSMETEFKPQTRGEIKYLRWFRIDHLPGHKKDTNCKTHLNLSPNSFFMVMPFIKRLKSWISKKQGRDSQSRRTPKGGKDKESASASTTPVSSDRHQQHKLLQQQRFAQQNQTEFHEFLHHSKSQKSASKEHRHKSQSPIPRFQKKHSQSATPSPGKNSLQILNRDGSLSGNGKTRRSLATQFTHSPVEHTEIQEGRRRTPKKGNQDFSSQAWLHFKFDIDKIMACVH